MHILWHMEFQEDYSQFPIVPAIDPERKVWSIFTEVPQQCKAYEKWRRRSSRTWDLHVYMSHFSAFERHPNSLPQDFFDFAVNILKRRQQSFVEWRNDEEPVVLLTPGLIIGEQFDMEPFISQAMAENCLVSVIPQNSSLLLGGLWVIPPSVQKEFCRKLPPSIEERFIADDLGVWRALARNIGEPVQIESEHLSNYLPQYSESDAFIENLDGLGEIMTQYPCPVWTEKQFSQWMSEQDFRFAKTMRWCPHEYIILKNYRSLDEQKNYLMAIDYLHRKGYINEWKDRFQFAVNVDGHKYWYCTAIDLLNRTSRELEKRIFAEDRKDEFGREIKV